LTPFAYDPATFRPAFGMTRCKPSSSCQVCGRFIEESDEIVTTVLEPVVRELMPVKLCCAFREA
jgi:hypothetical protein